MSVCCEFDVLCDRGWETTAAGHLSKGFGWIVGARCSGHRKEMMVESNSCCSTVLQLSPADVL